MAVDTFVKRRSISALLKPWAPAGIVPDGSVDISDRQAIAHGYASGVTPVLIPPVLGRLQFDTDVTPTIHFELSLD